VRAPRVGLLTFSDGRRHIHEDLLELNRGYQERAAAALRAEGFEVVEGEEIVWTPELAGREGRRMAAADVDLTVFNYAIWCFPHLSAIAARFAPGPYLLLCNLHPSEAGMVGMLAAAGTMEQLGERYTRQWGDVSSAEVRARLASYVRAASAVNRLRGQSYGLFGGRPLGMYTAVANPDQWMSLFGVDVEHIEQYDLIRYGAEVDDERVRAARRWLEERVGEIRYDGDKLTPEKLELQIRTYHAARRIIDERGLDFVGFKAQGDLTEHHVTMDVAEAFLNDPYDWEGPHEPMVAATEADMDGALTMQILKHLSGEPVLFADLRHYDDEDDLWYLANSGTHPTYFAGRSLVPEDNLRQVTFHPEVSYYPAGGASVQHFAAGGAMTLARLTRHAGAYRLTVAQVELVDVPRDRALAKAATTTPEWPHAFARMPVPAGDVLATWPCNHVHGVYGDWRAELRHVAEILQIELVELAT
jgi:L-fucose/D-arabinose isomerase